MSVLVAYAHTAEGRAALQHGQILARKEALPLVVFDLDAASTAEDHSVTTHHEPGAAPSPDEVPARWIARDHRSPDAASEFLDTAQEIDARVIVVGVRRRSPVGKLLLGSNAQHIIIGASVPVLAVKAGQHES
jgi:nucleotide-binding universal stress UspA family protein